MLNFNNIIMGESKALLEPIFKIIFIIFIFVFAFGFVHRLARGGDISESIFQFLLFIPIFIFTFSIAPVISPKIQTIKIQVAGVDKDMYKTISKSTSKDFELIDGKLYYITENLDQFNRVSSNIDEESVEKSFKKKFDKAIAKSKNDIKTSSMLNFDNMIITKDSNYNDSESKWAVAKVEVVNIEKSKLNYLLEKYPKNLKKENKTIYYQQKFNSKAIVGRRDVVNFLQESFEKDYKDKYSKPIKKKRKIDKKKLINLCKIALAVLMLGLNVCIYKVVFSEYVYDQDTIEIKHISYLLAGFSFILTIIIKFIV